MKESYFLLFGNCILTKGAKRSTICDLQLDRIRLIPNLLYDVLSMCGKMTIKGIKQFHENEYDDGIDAYLNLLATEGYGFFSQNPESFPEISMLWEIPNPITNSIIDITTNSQHPYEKIFQQLDQLKCIALELRFYDEISYDKLLNILELLADTSINSIELLLKYTKEIHTNLGSLFVRQRRIRSLTLHTSTSTGNKKQYDETNDVSISYIENVIDSELHCGKITMQSFSANIELFTESQQYNTCLNRKVSIDANGEIKNCPSMIKSYGNIRDVNLTEVINNVDFKKYWTINHNQIQVCSDCEFRHVCSDCRAYLTDSSNDYSKPKKCSYDPYTLTWSK